MENKNNRKALILVRFNKEIKIGKKTLPAASYKGEHSSKEVLFVPEKGSPDLNKNGTDLRLILISKNRYPFYKNGKTIFSVKIIEPEVVGKIKIFKNIFIPDKIFKKICDNGDNMPVAIIRGPNKEGKYETFLLRIAITDYNKPVVARFIKKNLLLEEMWIKENGIIEAIVKPSESEYLREKFWICLSNQLKPNLTEN